MSRLTLITPGVEDAEPRAPSIKEALRWLARHPPRHLGAEIVLRERFVTPWRLWIHADASEIAGLSLHHPGGTWSLVASGDEVARRLAAAVLGECVPSKVHLSSEDRDRLRPGIRKCCRIAREHDLVAMQVSTHPPDAEGRWAGPADVPFLESYQTAYNAERRAGMDHDWKRRVAERRTAVLEQDGEIVAVLNHSGSTPTHAAIGGIWTHPRRRRRGHATRLTAFVIGELLATHPHVHLVVDDDNAPAIGLYRGLGFETIGGVYFGYLEPR